MSAWSAVCIALAVAGFVISFFVWRRSGPARGIRAIAWSLIPLGVYLAGAATLLSRIGSAIAKFSSAFVWGPKSWLGVIFLGLAVVLFLTTGGLPVLRWNKRRKQAKAGQDRAAGGQPEKPAAVTSGAAKGGRKDGSATPADDDLAEVAEILRRRGIK
jgi:hypothetical protein